MAIQCVSRFYRNVKSAFFATRSLVQIFEQQKALQPQAVRLLGVTSNNSALSDVQKLIRLSTLDTKNQRLVSSGSLAAKSQNIALESQLIEKTSGPSCFLIADACPFDKALQVATKSGSVYAGICLI